MAKLDICAQCGRHGCIVLENGFIGPEFAFQKHGLEVIQSGVEWKRITPLDAARLEREILASSLPLNWDTVDLGVLWRLNAFNELRYQDIAIATPRHDFLHEPVDKRTVPSQFAEGLRRQYSDR